MSSRPKNSASIVDCEVPMAAFFVWLEKAYAERSNYVAFLKVFPLLDPLRSDRRFNDLIQRIGL
jgi:hypothetical protein